MTVVSYAQNYEDVMLLRALGRIERGFYIDVGAQDPVEDSVTKLFYERGWRGINIEPVASWYEKLAADRPGDVNLRIALGSREDELTFFEFPDTGLSTTDGEFAQRHLREGRHMIETVVRSSTLDAICEEHSVHTVHFLKIDVEGAERAVLEGFSFRVRPWIVLVEATLPNTQIPAYSDWEHLLTGHGYRLVYQDGLNRFYLDDAHSELAQAFAVPPNVFDRFVRFSEWRAKVELHQAHEEQRRLTATQDLLQTRERAAAAEAERNAVLAMASELRNSATAWSDIAKSQEATLGSLRDRLADRETEAAGLREQLRNVLGERDQEKLEAERLRNRLADLENEAADLGVQLRSTSEARYRAWMEIDRLRTVAECVPVLEAERRALAVQLLQRESELTDLRHELQRMLNSHSWVLTGPLRGARRQAGRMKAALRKGAVMMLRGLLVVAMSWAPVRALGRRVLANRPQLAERLRRLSGRLPTAQPTTHPGNPPTLSSVEQALTPRAREILRAMQAVESPASPGWET